MRKHFALQHVIWELKSYGLNCESLYILSKRFILQMHPGVYQIRVFKFVRQLSILLSSLTLRFESNIESNAFIFYCLWIGDYFWFQLYASFCIDNSDHILWSILSLLALFLPDDRSQTMIQNINAKTNMQSKLETISNQHKIFQPSALSICYRCTE